MKFERRRSEEREVVKATDCYSGEAAGYDVFLEVDPEQGARVTVTRRLSGATPGRLPMVSFHPRFVDDLEHLAASLPEVLRLAVEAMRALGLNDLRTDRDRRWEDIQNSVDRSVASASREARGATVE